MKARRPDYSPAMLRLFIAGAAVREGAETGIEPEAARRRVRDRLVTVTGLSRQRVVAAQTGRLKSAPARGALWGALGFIVECDLNEGNHDR